MALVCFYKPCAGRNKAFRDDWKTKTGQGVYYIWRAPKTADRSEWLQNLPEDHRSTFDFENVKHHFCSLHFEERFIVKANTYMVNGESHSYPFARWRLSKNAVPTIFEGTDLSSQMPDNIKISKNKKKLQAEKKLAKSNGRIDTARDITENPEEQLGICSGVVIKPGRSTNSYTNEENEKVFDGTEIPASYYTNDVEQEYVVEGVAIDKSRSQSRQTDSDSEVTVGIVTNPGIPVIPHKPEQNTSKLPTPSTIIVNTLDKIGLQSSSSDPSGANATLTFDDQVIDVGVSSDSELESEVVHISSALNTRGVQDEIEDITLYDTGTTTEVLATSDTPKQLKSQSDLSISLERRAPLIAIAPKPFLVVPGQYVPDPRISSSGLDSKRRKIMTVKPREVRIAPKPVPPGAEVDARERALNLFPSTTPRRSIRVPKPKPHSVVRIAPKPVTASESPIILLKNPRTQPIALPNLRSPPNSQPRLIIDHPEYHEPPTVYKPRILTRAKTKISRDNVKDPITVDNFHELPVLLICPRKQNLSKNENTKSDKNPSKSDTVDRNLDSALQLQPSETQRNVSVSSVENLSTSMSRLSMPSQDWSVNSYTILGNTETEEIFTISETVLTRRNVEIIRKSMTVQTNRGMTFTVFSHKIHKMNYLGLHGRFGHDENSIDEIVQQGLNNFHAYQVCEGIRQSRLEMNGIKPFLITDCVDHCRSNWCPFLLNVNVTVVNKSKSAEQINRCDKCEEIVECLRLLDSGAAIPSKYKPLVEK